MNVFRITDYLHPFDLYKGQDVILFDEFRSSLKIQDMLNYLDGYPLELPCRYANKIACYTKVYLISNISLESQYMNIQLDSPETWDAFLRRIHTVEHRVDIKKVNRQDAYGSFKPVEGETPFDIFEQVITESSNV